MAMLEGGARWQACWQCRRPALPARPARDLVATAPPLHCSYLWLTILYNITYTVALYGLLLFYLVREQ